MTFHFRHTFDRYNYLTDEEKKEIAIREAADDLAKEIIKHAYAEVDEEGNVRGVIKII